jgi:biofilm protein TabA
MILDLLTNYPLYRRLSDRIDLAFAYLHQADLRALEPGDYEIDGRNIFAKVQTYTTRPPEQGTWEAHRRYIDLQVMIEGEEHMGYAPLNLLTPAGYDEARDFLRLSGHGDRVTLRSGSFVLLWPGDGHMPCLAVCEPMPVKKVVVKIAVD